MESSAQGNKAKAAKKGGNAAGKYMQCNVCLDTDMAKGMKQCKVHNHTARAIIDTLKDAPLQQFEALRDQAPDAPAIRVLQRGAGL